VAEREPKRQELVLAELQEEMREETGALVIEAVLPVTRDDVAMRVQERERIARLEHTGASVARRGIDVIQIFFFPI
jgi:hypothetical protein